MIFKIKNRCTVEDEKTNTQGQEKNKQYKAEIRKRRKFRTKKALNQIEK